MLQDRLAQGLAMFGSGTSRRAVRLLNHVLRREPALMARLLPHAGRIVELRFADPPVWMPKLAAVRLQITPAGLFDLDDAADGTEAVLWVTIALVNPLGGAADLLSGDLSSIQLTGDAPFAADVRWLLENLRWEVEDDLERVVGPVAAHGIGRAGSYGSALARQALATLKSLRGPKRPAA